MILVAVTVSSVDPVTPPSLSLSTHTNVIAATATLLLSSFHSSSFVLPPMQATYNALSEEDERRNWIASHHYNRLCMMDEWLGR